MLAVALGGALLSPAAIEAHAGLVRSEPAAGAVLATPPGEVALWFSEPVVPSLTEVTVLDAGGAGGGRGELAFDSSDRTAVRLAVDELVDGVYTVVWRSVSSVDGHAVSGQLWFAVGEASGTLPRAEERAQSSGAAGTAARWLASAPALAAFGLVLIAVLGLPEIDVGRLRRWALGLLPLALLGAGALLVVQLSGTGGLEGFGDTLTSRWGLLWASRVMALGTALALLLARRRAPALAVLVLALAATSAASHAAASNAAVPATLADLAHRLAAGAWLGGLLGVALSWRAARDRVALARAFTGVATVVVGGLLAFGVVSALAEVGSWAALRTPYGTVLLLKVGGSAAVLALAAVNRWWLTPRLAGAGERWLLRLVVIEGVLLLALIAGGARLANLEPAWQAAAREGGLVPRPQAAEDLRVAIHISPGVAGANDIEVRLRDRRGAAVERARVRAALRGPGLEPDELAAHDLGDGLYHVAAAPLNVAGAWTLGIEVQRPDGFDARTSFAFEVGVTRPAAAPPSAARVATAAGLAALAVGALVAVSMAGRRRLASAADV